MMGDLIGRVDRKFGDSLDRIKEELKKIGIENVSDRIASRVAADILQEISFSFQRKVKKRKDKIIINL